MNAYIAIAKRTAVGKSGKGGFAALRPDDLAAQLIEKMLNDIPQLDKDTIDDVIVGNATPEAEQGLNVGRMISLMGLKTDKVPGITINRYCSSGLEAIAIASAKINSGMADCIIAGGVECMSPIPFGGWRIAPNAAVAKDTPGYYWGMGLTAEEVAKRYKVSREDQDAFALESQNRALRAIESGTFEKEIIPIEYDLNTFGNGKVQTKKVVVAQDEGPRKGTNFEALAKLRPVFSPVGTVTAGNASQTSDGASFVLVCSEQKLKELNLEPIAKMVSYHVSGVEPEIMGIGPIHAIPGALKRAGMSLNEINKFELNEAFASQSLAIIRELGMNPDIVNVNGGAIALGHPLGCTGAKLTTQILHDLEKNNEKYGMVTMCVGTGQGAAGIFEKL